MTNSFSLTQVGNFNIPPVTGTTAYCVGATMALTGNTGSGDQWEWRKGTSFATATVITGYAYSNNVANKIYSKTFASADAGNYYFVVKTVAGCETNSTITITANPIPTISGATSVCMGSSSQLTGSGTAAASNAWV